MIFIGRLNIYRRLKLSLFLEERWWDIKVFQSYLFLMSCRIRLPSITPLSHSLRLCVCVCECVLWSKTTLGTFSQEKKSVKNVIFSFLSFYYFTSHSLSSLIAWFYLANQSLFSLWTIFPNFFVVVPLSIFQHFVSESKVKTPNVIWSKRQCLIKY